MSPISGRMRQGLQYAAGYEVTPGAPTPVSSVKGTFTVPAITACPSAKALLDPLIQITATTSGPTSAEGTGMYVLESCATSSPSYQGVTYVETGGKPTSENVPFTISPGNLIAVAASVSSKGALKVKVEDKTTTQTFTQSGSTPAGGRYYAVAEVNTTGFPIPTFGTVGWQSVTVNGQPISAENPSKLIMKNPATSDLVINTSALSPAGMGFTNKFAANQ
jgi:hypothetical protein